MKKTNQHNTAPFLRTAWRTHQLTSQAELKGILKERKLPLFPMLAPPLHPRTLLLGLPTHSYF